MPSNDTKFFVNEFQELIWKENYRFKDETIEETQHRLVETIFKDESKPLKKALYDALINRRIIFGGRVAANVGTKVKNVSFFNCYAWQRTKKPYDSIENIYEDLKIACHILKTEGGVGIDFSHIRPKGTYIKGIASRTPGVVSFLEVYDKTSDIITRGADVQKFQIPTDSFVKTKQRKGAMISILSIYHPDIIDYIEAKKYPNYLTKFNMSVSINDEFMKTLVEDGDWNLCFPDIHYKGYDEEWDGNIQKWVEDKKPTIIYKTMKSRELWNILLQNAYNRNEPGILFIDNAERYNNLSGLMRITGTNPCVAKGTLISTDKGDIEITDIIERFKNGETFKVLTYNIDKKIVEYEDLTFADMTREDSDLIKIELDNGTEISLTPDHLVYTENRGYIKASLLTENDELIINQ